MQSCDIVRSSPVRRTARVMQMQGLFDVPPAERSGETWRIELDLPEQWNIGLIVGPSGSGKTTISRELFRFHLMPQWKWPRDESVLDGFPAGMGIKDIVELLSSVGFSSPPSWVRPFCVLSTGEQFRVAIARALAEKKDLLVVDEYSSVVDRTVAKIGSAAIARTIRKRLQKFIAVTCHYDVIDWLEPDWIFQPHLNRLDRRLLRGRPKIELEICRADKAAWQIFSKHHYLSASLHRAAKCFVASVQGLPAAFVAVLPFPHPRVPGWREHRCVCLPDFQGVGIGNALSEYVAGLFASTGKPYSSVTSHPGMIAHRARSKTWRMKRFGFVPQPGVGSSVSAVDKNISRNRLTGGFEYRGAARADDAAGFEIIAARPSRRGVVGRSRA